MVLNKEAAVITRREQLEKWKEAKKKVDAPSTAGPDTSTRAAQKQTTDSIKARTAALKQRSVNNAKPTAPAAAAAAAAGPAEPRVEPAAAAAPVAPAPAKRAALGDASNRVAKPRALEPVQKIARRDTVVVTTAPLTDEQLLVNARTAIRNGALDYAESVCDGLMPRLVRDARLWVIKAELAEARQNWVGVVQIYEAATEADAEPATVLETGLLQFCLRGRERNAPQNPAATRLASTLSKIVASMAVGAPAPAAAATPAAAAAPVAAAPAPVASSAPRAVLVAPAPIEPAFSAPMFGVASPAPAPRPAASAAAALATPSTPEEVQFSQAFRDSMAKPNGGVRSRCPDAAAEPATAAAAAAAMPPPAVPARRGGIVAAASVIVNTPVRVRGAARTQMGDIDFMLTPVRRSMRLADGTLEDTAVEAVGFAYAPNAALLTEHNMVALSATKGRTAHTPAAVPRPARAATAVKKVVVFDDADAVAEAPASVGRARPARRGTAAAAAAAAAVAAEVAAPAVEEAEEAAGPRRSARASSSKRKREAEPDPRGSAKRARRGGATAAATAEDEEADDGAVVRHLFV